jgi:hypothetical protein
MEERGDRIGQLLAAAGLIEAQYFEWTSFHPTDQWIDVIAAGLEQAPAFPSSDAELRVYSAHCWGSIPILPRCKIGFNT